MTEPTQPLNQLSGLTDETGDEFELRVVGLIERQLDYIKGRAPVIDDLRVVWALED